MSSLNLRVVSAAMAIVFTGLACSEVQAQHVTNISSVAQYTNGSVSTPGSPFGVGDSLKAEGVFFINNLAIVSITRPWEVKISDCDDPQQKVIADGTIIVPPSSTVLFVGAATMVASDDAECYGADMVIWDAGLNELGTDNSLWWDN